MRSGESGWFIGCRAGDALARWQHSWREVFLDARAAESPIGRCHFWRRISASRDVV
jgi:hypothetical protein